MPGASGVRDLLKQFAFLTAAMDVVPKACLQLVDGGLPVTTAEMTVKHRIATAISLDRKSRY